ncbi:MAG: hypothetical protein QM753_12055 [Thermomicrobiales bacterium]
MASNLQDIPDDRRCTAHSKRTGERCGQWAAKGRTTCRYHGGTQKRGMAHPNTTHGRYSKDLPARLRERYETAEADPDLLNLTGNIALLDTLIVDAAANLAADASGQLWFDLEAAWTAFEVAQRAQDRDALATALAKIAVIIDKGAADASARKEIAVLSDQRRKAADSERKRRVDMQQMLSVNEAMMLVTTLSEAVMQHVSDPAVRAAIAVDMDRLINHGADGRPHGA